MEAAIACFIDKGFHATSMRDIARQANVSLGNLYTYFPGKQQLIAEVAELERLELEPMLETLEALAAPNVEDVMAFLARYRTLNLQTDWAVLAAECLAELARSSPLRPVFEANRLRLLDAFVAAIERGATSGTLRPAADPRAIAQLLLDGVEAEALREAIMSDRNGGSQVISVPLLRCLFLA